MLQLLKDAPQTKRIGLCLDNDKAGIQARERLTGILLENGYAETFSLFPKEKDWNRDLQAHCEAGQTSGFRQEQTVGMQ